MLNPACIYCVAQQQNDNEAIKQTAQLWCQGTCFLESGSGVKHLRNNTAFLEEARPNST